jgi:glycosyltransferase involved in cell wall biosynthesis
MPADGAAARTLAVVCPVYNEAEVIARFHEALGAVLDSISGRYRATVVYVVDRSADGTLDILRGIAARDPRVRVLGLSTRFGHQMSLLAGIDHADADAVVMLDSDLQHPPELIPTLLDEFEKGRDIVYTVRRDSDDIGFFKRITSRLFYRFINLLSQIPIDQSAADYRLVSRRVARVFRTQIRERNQFLRGLFGWVGFERVGVPFTVRGRGAGRSKYSIRRLFSFAVAGITSFSKRPLQAAIYVGFAFAILALVLAATTVVQFFLHRSLPPGWATIVIVVCGLSGIQLIFLGIIGEYIGAIFDEVKARPHYLIEEKINFPPGADGPTAGDRSPDLAP